MEQFIGLILGIMRHIDAQATENIHIHRRKDDGRVRLQPLELAQLLNRQRGMSVGCRRYAQL